MNTKTCLTLLTVLAAAVTAVAQDQKLEDYTSQEGKFKIKFPGKATEQKQSVNTDAGPSRF